MCGRFQKHLDQREAGTTIRYSRIDGLLLLDFWGKEAHSTANYRWPLADCPPNFGASVVR
jgi:hypothetical protein